MYIVNQTKIGKEKLGHNSRAVLHRKPHQAHTNSRTAGCRTIVEVKKEGKQATGFRKSEGAETAGRSTTRQPAVEGQRTPGQRGSRGFQRETADGEGDTTPKPLPCPVSPGGQPGKRARERDHDGSATI